MRARLSWRRAVCARLGVLEDVRGSAGDGQDSAPSAEEKGEALRMLEDVAKTMRRVLGPTHPDTLHAQGKLKFYRRKFPGA